MSSEKCAAGQGRNDDDMRMITASVVRVIERFAGDLCLHFLPLFQKVVVISKTCNQLIHRVVRNAGSITTPEAIVSIMA